MRNILLIGASGQGKVVADIVEKEGIYSIAGFIDTYKKSGESFFGYDILGKEEDIPELIKKYSIVGCIITIGDNWTRSKLYEKVLSIAPNLEFVNAIHPSVQIGKNVKIGPGTVVMAGAVINPDSDIGKCCIINTNSSLDHDCVMDNFSCVLPGATVGGNVRLGKFSVIALGANVLHGISIGNNSVVGAGSVVTHDVPELSVSYGVPAKIVRSRVEGEKYL